MYDDDSIMPRGQYKFRRLKDIPAEYFLNLWETSKGGSDLELRNYIIQNLEKIKERKGQPVPQAPPKQEIVTFICQKVTFATKRIALDSLNKIRSDGGKRIKPQRAYECPLCSGWHLTSQEPRKKKK